MTNKNNFKRGILRGSSALSAFAVIGGGLAISTVVATPAFAQDFTTGAIVGSVRGPDGATVTSGTAVVRSNEQGFERNATIGEDGNFRVTALPTGTYTVTVSSPGFQSVADPNIRVTAGTSNTWVFTMAAAAAGGATTDAAGDEIVVVGQAVRANDFAQTTTGLLVDVDELSQTVPVGRNQTSLILLAPGTQAGDTGFGNLASISGATVAENSYYVNGLNTTDFRNFVGSSIVPFEFYKTLDVQTGGYQAEFGRALGGFVNATTKSGGNDFEGGAIISYSPDALQEDSPNTYAAFNQDDYSENGSATFFVSGPVLRDRLFFYAFYNPRFFEVSDTSITSGFRIRDRGNTPFWGGKADAIITDGHRLEFTVFSDKQNRTLDYTRTNSASNAATGGQIGRVVLGTGGVNYIGTYTGQFTEWFTLSGSYGKNVNRGRQRANPNRPLIQSTLTGTTTQAAGATAGQSDDKDTREIYRVDADLYVNNFLGDHHFRAGWDTEKLTSQENTTYTGAGGYRYILRPADIRRFFYRTTGTYKTEYSSFYLQDSWNLFDERLNLNIGVRNDRFENKTVAGETYYETKNNWGPRLGATFDVFGDRRTKLQAFWGRYFLPIATNTNIRLGGNELYYEQRFRYPGFGTPGYVSPTAAGFNSVGLPNNLQVDANGDPITGTPIGNTPCPEVGPDAGENCVSIFSDGLLGPTDTLIDQNLKPSFTDEIIIGATHRMGDWTGSIQYINRRLGSTLDDLAIDLAVIKYCKANGIEGCGFIWSGFHQYVLDNPGTDMTVRLDGGDACEDEPRLCEVVTLTEEQLGYPNAVRKYDSVQFSLNKRWDGRWSFNGSYVWTKLRGNYEGAVTSDQNQSDAGLTQDFDQPGLLEGRFGSLPNERRHTFKAYGAYQVLPWLRIGVNAQVASPRKFSCLGNYRNSPYTFDFASGDITNPETIYGASSHWCTQPQFANKNAGVVNPTTPTFGPDGGYVDYGPGEDGAYNPSYLVPRGTAFKSDWFKQIDLGFAFTIPGLEGSEARIDVFNVLNTKAKLDFNEFGDIGRSDTMNTRYGEVLGFQSPRSVRFTLGFRFGPNTGTMTDEDESMTQGR